MTRLVFITPEQKKLIKEVLSEDAILVSDPNEKRKLEEKGFSDGDETDHNFECQPQVMFDFATSEHPAFRNIDEE
ncbi:hypothetical protein [Vibrio owensii]|uniref:Uncharacterized protein n=1 Tax=Vibrio owensii CAIM 1854 = LMG 25443 TaxID=1229493 RepID=A0A0C1Z8V1_9VIBR|nr:hypothetical protein [Vibrio owensii]KIF53375.1 hypothetical protein H735_10670 [Vibrio owensii CAIM 1854 = LMG 25443]